MKVKYLEFSGLLNVGVSDFGKPLNELSAIKNCYEYKIGKLEKVPGYSLATASQVIDEQDVNYLHHYYDTANKINYLLATSTEGSDLTLEYRTTGNFATITGISTTWYTYAGSLPHMANYLSKTFIVGYKSGTTFLPNATINATTFSTADTDLTDMPQGKFVVGYKDLLYVLHAKTGGSVYPSRAYYSDEPIAGAIGWTVLTSFVEFGIDDGDEITGALESLDRLLVWKQYSMWKYDESEVKKIADVGCDSYKSIINVFNIPYWFNRNGIWRWGGDKPQLISSKVQPFIDAIDQTALDEVVAVQYEYEYRCFIGDVTVEDVNYTNTWICFDSRREKIYIRCTYDVVKSTATYVESGKQRAYFGNDDGQVMKFATKIDKIYADNGNEIDSFFVTNNLDFGSPDIIKQNSKITIYTKNAQGLNFMIDPDNSGEFEEGRGQVLKTNVEDLDINSSGYRFRFKFAENSTVKGWELEGFIVETEIKEEP